MKVALIGDGKTGKYVKGLIDKKDLIGPFNLDHKLEEHSSKLKLADLGISFAPGPYFLKIIPILLEMNLPMVIGSTGFNFPETLNDDLIKRGITWVYASNYSLGILIMKELMDTLKDHTHLLPFPEVSIHEIHHIMKKDAPSGTALSLEKWLSPDKKLTITSSRVGDVIGTHEVKVETKTEAIRIIHEAKNRAIFAHGAVSAAKTLNGQMKKIPKGLITFHDLIELKNGGL